MGTRQATLQTRLAEDKWFRNPSITWLRKTPHGKNYQKLNYSFQWGLCTCFSNLTMIFVYIYQIGRLTNENWEQALAKSKLSCEGRRRWSREGKARADAARRLFWCFPSLSVFRYLGTEKFVKSTLIPSTGIIKKIVTDWSLLFPTGWTDIFIT